MKSVILLFVLLGLSTYVLADSVTPNLSGGGGVVTGRSSPIPTATPLPTLTPVVSVTSIAGGVIGGGE